MKHKIRQQLLKKRIKQNIILRKYRDRKILKKIASLEQFKKAKKVLFYMPIYGEVDIVNLFEKFNGQKKFYLPRVVGKELDIHEVNNIEDLENGAFDIPEPKKHLHCIQPEELDLVLIPGIAFAKNGHRIGYGYGYFDKMLKKTSCPKIGIAYAFQLVKNIGGEPHDVPVDIIVTNKKIIRVQPTSNL